MLKVRKGQIVFWKYDLFPYMRWAIITDAKVNKATGRIGITNGYAVIPRHILSKKAAAPIIEALELLSKHEYAARHALALGFIDKLKVIAPFISTKEWKGEGRVRRGQRTR